MARKQLKDFAVGEQTQFIKARLARMGTAEIVADAAKKGFALTPGSVAAVKAHVTRDNKTYKSPLARAGHDQAKATVKTGKGARGPRDIYFVCVSIKRGNLVTEEILARTTAEAEGAFKDKHKTGCTVLNGRGFGYYHVQGTGVGQGHCEVITIDIGNILPNGRNFKAQYVYNGVAWNVNAIGICACESSDGRSFGDGELFQLNYISTVDGKKADKPKTKRNEVVEKSKLTHLVKR